MYSTASRAAPSPPAWGVIQWASAFSRAGVLDCNGQAAAAHYWQVDDIVTYAGGFGGGDSLLLEDLAEDACLILNALVDVVDFQIAGAKGDGLR